MVGYLKVCDKEEISALARDLRLQRNFVNSLSADASSIVDGSFLDVCL